MKIAISLPITLLLALFFSQLPGSAAADPYNKMPPPKAPPTHKKPSPEAAPRPRIPPAIDAVQRRPGEKPGAGAGSDEDIDSLLGEPAGPTDSKPPSKSTTGADVGIDDIDLNLDEPGAAPGASVAPPPPTPPSEPAPAPAAPKPLKDKVRNQMSALLAGGEAAPGGKVKHTKSAKSLTTGTETHEFTVGNRTYVLTVPKDGKSEMVEIDWDGSRNPVDVPADFGRKAP